MSQLRIGRRSVCAAAGVLLAGRSFAQVADTRPKVALKTGLGQITLALETAKVPITSANFLRYVALAHHEGANFFRATRTVGAPTTGFIEGRLENNPARMFPPIRHESTLQTGLTHQDGTISMARSALGTARIDFFVCCGPQPSLDADPNAPGDNAGFAAFGSVIDGMDVVRAILALPTPGKARNPAMEGQMLDPPVPILSLRKLV